MSIKDKIKKYINKNLPSKMLDNITPNIEGRCWNCKRPIFNLDSHFGKLGLCVYCNSAREFGIKSTKNNYNKQLILTCQNCGHKLAYRVKNGIELFEINKIALCCDKPDYSY